VSKNQSQSEPETRQPPDSTPIADGLRSEADRILGPVARAEAELKRAKEAYDRVCEEAAQRLRDVREAKVGDVCDGVLEQVKRHPGPSLIVAAVLGFFLGRLFRR
jgi:ElaB/YqjD/DUF883 family membrane-anchored ribosome-binding protein